MTGVRSMKWILAVLVVLVPVLSGILLLIFHPRKSARPVIAAAALTLVLAVGTAVTVRGSFTAATFMGQLPLTLGLDLFGAFFLVLIPAIFLLSVVFALEYTEYDVRKRHVFFGFTMLTLGAMCGLCLAGNLFTFYLFFEAMSFASFPLVLYPYTAAARGAAVKYLGFSVFGAGLVLAGMMLCGTAGLQTFAPGGVGLGKDPLHLAAWLLMAVGFACKAGMYPLSAWLPTAHPEAPAPASAMLSGVITKAGVLGVARTTLFLFGAQMLAGTGAQQIMLVLTLITIFIGSMLAYKEPLLKKRLAYSSVSQLSYVLFGLMLMTPAGFTGAMLQVLFHACAKTGLFLCAGAIIHKSGLLRAGELRGMGRRMPVTMGCFALFSLSLVGIPPLGGFDAKWSLAMGALEYGGVLAAAGIVVLLVSALLTAGYLLPIVSIAFFPGEDFASKKCEPGRYMTLPLTVLAAVVLVFGAFPGVFSGIFDAVCAALL